MDHLTGGDVLGDEGLAALTKELSVQEMTTMRWSAAKPSDELDRKTLAASADAFTHLGDRWDAYNVFADGACCHDKDPHLASAVWGVTDGRRSNSGLVLGQQTAMIREVHGAIVAAWHTAEGGTIWTDSRTV